MNKRLREIVNYKTRGKQKEFAELVGWTPQYLAKLLHGSDFGLKPVLSVLKAMPEINARWLLLGEGQMLTDGGLGDLYKGTLNHIQAVLDLERFIPVMTPEELREYHQMIMGHKVAEFDPQARSKWIELSADRAQEVINRVKDAERKSDELCKRKTVKE